MERNLRKNNGITLVALVVTIIILLILAGITISQLSGSGLFENAKLAKEKTENAQIEENTLLNEYTDKINEIVGSRDTVTIAKEEYENIKKAADYFSRKINPKYICTISLPSSGGSNRSAGVYKASTTSFTKNNKTDFDNYFIFEANKGWTVKESGEFGFNTFQGATGSGGHTISSSIIINDNVIELASGNLDARTAIDSSYTTIYLEKGTVIDFEYNVEAASSWNSQTINIFALFE